MKVTEQRCGVVGLTTVKKNKFVSLQFTTNKIMYKIFGAMSKDLYSEIYIHFGIDYVENLVANRRNRLDMVKQTVIYVKCCADPVRLKLYNIIFGTLAKCVPVTYTVTACCVHLHQQQQQQQMQQHLGFKERLCSQHETTTFIVISLLSTRSK